MLNSDTRRLFAVLAVSLISTGCTAWHPVAASTLDQGSPRVYKRLLVVTRDGYEVQITDASIRIDSVVGTLTGAASGQRAAFSHDQVTRIETQDPDVGPALEQGRGFLAATAAQFLKMMGCVFTLGRVC